MSNSTPILALSPQYDVRDEKNCLIVRSPKAFLEAIFALHADQRLWERLGTQGLWTVGEHAVHMVADKLFEQLSEIRECRHYE